MQSGNWRRPVSYSSQPVGSDPFFVGPGRSPPKYVQKNSLISNKGSSASPTKQKSASHSFSGEPKTPVKAPQQDASESANGSVYRPRKDREVAEISGDNAQAIFPPNACVFVAK